MTAPMGHFYSGEGTHTCSSYCLSQVHLAVSIYGFTAPYLVNHEGSAQVNSIQYSYTCHKRSAQSVPNFLPLEPT